VYGLIEDLAFQTSESESESKSESAGSKSKSESAKTGLKSGLESYKSVMSVSMSYLPHNLSYERPLDSCKINVQYTDMPFFYFGMTIAWWTVYCTLFCMRNWTNKIFWSHIYRAPQSSNPALCAMSVKGRNDSAFFFTSTRLHEWRWKFSKVSFNNVGTMQSAPSQCFGKYFWVRPTSDGH